MSASYISPPSPSAMLPPRITRSGLPLMVLHPEVSFAEVSLAEVSFVAAS
jgi:hypothetical protein